MKLIPALAMLLIATTLVSTATFAWFSMNTQVSATNMQVRAVAEKGLLINEINTYSDTNWDEVATANQTANDSAVLLYPASTADGATWYHAASKKSNDAASAASGAKSGLLIGNYEDLAARNDNTGLVNITAMTSTATAGTAAAKETKGDTATSEAGYYVHYTYYLKSAGAAIGLGTNAGDMNVRIKSVTATTIADPLSNNGTPANSAALDPAIRVGIKLNSAFYIYAPVTGYTATYYVAAGTTATTPTAGSTATNTDLATLPSTGTNGTPVDVFIWYEGEDAACKSDNATAVTLDNIKIDIVFALEQVPTP